MWTFGAILSFMLIAQIVTGVVLAMHYIGSPTEAFTSVTTASCGTSITVG